MSEYGPFEQGLEAYGPIEDEDYYYGDVSIEVIDQFVQRSIDKALSSALKPISKRLKELSGCSEAPSSSLPTGPSQPSACVPDTSWSHSEAYNKVSQRDLGSQKQAVHHVEDILFPRQRQEQDKEGSADLQTLI
ncbi:hypothetical protein NDU88_001197 [Pleurodeles waltl]|uniref:Uncharacterized protein n=1 Tax=Pleurodeles waltl TaxID=8319 RepID=A0AAV7LF77_PLEWA|nr:hypothetical protein NDU88_001197 [Pleurodeles waltl]